MLELSPKRVPFIVGCARSGTTWLGKVFDSHPDVFYLHEPDSVDRGLDLLPYWLSNAPSPEQISAAHVYLQRLLAVRTPRATGTRPYFRKRYRSSLNDTVRRGLIHLTKGIEGAGLGAFASRVNIPNLSARGRTQRTVIKSVNALGRTEALIKGAKDLHPVLLLRHPCAYVASQLRGMALGVMGPESRPGALLETRSARELCVRDLAVAAKTPAEMLTWNWLLANAEAYSAIQAHGGTTVVYEALVNNDLAEAKSLFAKLGLGWARETEIFLRRSWASDGSYYSVFRNPEGAVNGWREELDGDTAARVMAIARRHPLGRLALGEPCHQPERTDRAA